MAHQKGIAKIKESLDMVGKSQSVCILVLERNLCCEEPQPPRAAGNGPGQTRKPSLVAQELSKASSPSLPYVSLLLNPTLQQPSVALDISRVVLTHSTPSPPQFLPKVIA
ncbi:hypothetical protein PABG_11065 [Paracoccidioides brasiliensis Pb03]|nr:hypothetical protein PABG_11065 [Paracoccidioides brasiliensis Pb03]